MFPERDKYGNRPVNTKTLNSKFIIMQEGG